MKSSLSRVRNASHLLPTGGELVRDLADEIELLRKELERRDKVVDGLVELIISKDGAKECLRSSGTSLPRCTSRLCAVKVIREANQKIHNDLWLSPESTESEPEHV